MAAETIYKLEPHRTMHLRGFDRRGAAAALHSASSSGFTVSGVFRDMADFAVLVLWDADNFFEHCSMKYLPSFDFSGMVLTFDLHYTGLQPIESVKYNWIDWATVDAIREDGTTASIRLADHATVASGTHSKAATTFVLGTPTAYTHVTLWYQNIAFDWWGNGIDTPTVLQVLTAIANQVNAYDWGSIDMPLTASIVAGPRLKIEATLAGEDGNHIQAYTTSNGTSFGDPDWGGWLVGGSSDVTWAVTLDFTELGIESVRQMWMTFAPKLPRAEAYAATEWSAVFSDWSVTDPGDVRALKIAGPGSVRVVSGDAWCAYSGSGWAREAGWFHDGFARVSSTAGDSITVEYHCDHEHDLYVGTSLYTDRGIATVSLDGDAATDLDCYLDAEPEVATRRRVRTAVGAGAHSVTIAVTSRKNAASSGFSFYFDFVEAAVAGDVQDPVATYADVALATDYDTDHTYKLAPARLVWDIARTGFLGPVDHYVGVFWWGQRTRVGGSFPAWEITFGGTWAYGDSAFVTIGGTTMGKSVFPTDTIYTMAQHFASFINCTFIGVWAVNNGAVVTVHALSPVWEFSTSISFSSSAGTMTASGSLTGGVEGTWTIDAAARPALNRAATDWHADFFAELAAAGIGCVAALSMELVDPPDNPPGAVWAARYANGTAVLTATGFGSLYSTHCSFAAAVAAYQGAAFAELAAAMDGAGLDPWVQFGEFVWWYFAGAGTGMAYYDAETAAAAETALGRALATFASPTDDPAINSYADAQFLRGRLKAHIDAVRTVVLAACSGAQFELLWPYDVCYPTASAFGVGGRLNRYVSLPAEYEQKSGSGLDRMKVEGLAFGSQERNLAKAQEAMVLAFQALLWDRADVAYLLPWFNGGCPWRAEYLAARRARVPAIAMWAIDHLALLGRELPLPLEVAVGRVF